MIGAAFFVVVQARDAGFKFFQFIHIAQHGIRNALLTSIAPTGTISLLADNVSSGLEPVFSFTYTRRILMPDGTRKEEEVSDYAYRLYKRVKGENAPLTDAFVDAQKLTPADHVVMQAAVQAYIDSMRKYGMIKAQLQASAITDLSMLEKSKSRLGWK